MISFRDIQEKDEESVVTLWKRCELTRSWNEMNAVVFEVVLKFGGSISAEHGIGRLKKHHMPEIKSAVELQMMRELKKLFDPGNIMNPGKVLPP